MMAKQVYGAALALAAVGLIANVAWAANGVRTIYGAGTATCGEWQQQRSSGSKHLVVQLEAWIDGFLSGYNFKSDATDFLATRPDGPAVAYYAWIDNYCRQNPLDRVGGSCRRIEDRIDRQSAPLAARVPKRSD
jgi:hypothetical protein